jgi:putative ABC transport system permease protein
MLADLWRDVRYALRTFRRSPGFALAAVAPIALAIGIDTSVFTVLYNVIARPLPAPSASELVSV